MKYDINTPASYRVIENFYTDPDAVLSLAKEFPLKGCGPDKSIYLHELDRNFYDSFCNAIAQLYPPKPNKNYNLTSFFSRFQARNPKLLDNGWWKTAGHDPTTCRYDSSAENLVYCGVITLTKNTDPGTVFEMGKLKPELNWTKQKFIDETCNYYTVPREKYVAGEISFDEYKELYYKHEQNFYPVISVKQTYNTFISWTTDVINRELRNDKEVINQYFFLSEF